MDKREHLAAILWRTQAEGTGTPQIVIDRRTPEAFENENQQTRDKWLKYADAAIAALELVTVQEMPLLEIAEAMQELLERPQGVIPACADKYYDGKTGVFTAELIGRALTEQDGKV